MVQIGKMNRLKVVKHVDFGVFLDGGEEDGEILLPLRYMPEQCDIDDEIDVFICYDSEDRLMATTQTPIGMVGDFVNLKIVNTGNVGAFLDWGLPKDLFLPFAEQTRPLRAGQEVLVYIYVDNTGRLSASMRIERHLETSGATYKDGDEVSLIIAGQTDLGYKAIIDGRYIGVLYRNEVFKTLHQGQKIQGFIKKMREDGKIDLALSNSTKTGHKAAEDIGPQVLAKLEQEGGYLPINDKTSADVIYEMFGVSKKKYKIAIGGLYKKRLIKIDDDGIRLLKPSAAK